MFTFNLNQYIRFKLTPHGEDVWRKNSLLLGLHKYGIPLVPDPIDDEGTREVQCWQAMNVLGPHFQNGFNNVIECNAVTVVEDAWDRFMFPGEEMLGHA